jgi:hypothetical protein
MEAQIANLSNKKKRKNEIRKIETRAPFTETETLSLPSTLSFTIDRSKFGTTTPRRRYLR